MNKRSGISLIEALVTCLLLGVVMGGMFQLVVSVNKANTFTVTMPVVQDEATRIVNLIASDLATAPLCTASSGCTTDSAIHSAAASSVSMYTAASGARRTYTLENGALKRFIGTATTADLTVNDVSAFALKYCSSTDYNMATIPAVSGWPTSITSGANTKQINAISISLTINQGGLKGEYSTIVRLRNSPKKP